MLGRTLTFNQKQVGRSEDCRQDVSCATHGTLASSLFSSWRRSGTVRSWLRRRPCANAAERLGAAQVVIGSIGADFVPFVLMFLPSLRVHRLGLMVPEGVRCHQLHVARELRKLSDGSLGGSEIRGIRARIADAVDTQLTDHERKIGCLELASQAIRSNWRAAKRWVREDRCAG